MPLRRSRKWVRSRRTPADIAKGLKGAREAGYRLSEARRKLGWEETFRLFLDGEKTKAYYKSVPPEDQHSCSIAEKCAHCSL
ncbi:phosphomethylpyrimidine synthase ThiC [Caproicibacter fermentans]|uniref:phosphomethylpyrimidine synthase ThiC n=1 Tax=Caproicibacter fermentans TaxID=2576756 RepID=UPI001E41D213|nr:phosphomethylpyrimidine synthase ThiC [Caproicibacter fermentans]